MVSELPKPVVYSHSENKQNINIPLLNNYVLHIHFLTLFIHRETVVVGVLYLDLSIMEDTDTVKLLVYKISSMVDVPE